MALANMNQQAIVNEFGEVVGYKDIPQGRDAVQAAMAAGDPQEARKILLEGGVALSDDYDFMRDAILRLGGSPEFAEQQRELSRISAFTPKEPDDGFLKGMLSSGVEFGKEVAPLAAAAAATYFGAQGLGALLPAEAAAAGGTAAAEGGTALGTGLTPGTSATFAPGMSTATGTGLIPPSTAAGSIGGGALGSGITTPIAATSPWHTSLLAPATAGGTAMLGAAGGAGAAGAGGASGGATGAGTAAASGGALSRIIDGTATADDWLELVGRAAPAAFGAFASDRQADAYSDLAERYMGFGEPSRGRFEASFAPGFSMATDPGYTDALDQTTKSFLHKASVDGNPADSPNAWQQTLKDVNASFAYPALQNYRQVNANTGGLASFAPAAVNAEGASVGAQKGIYDSVGYGAANIFSPPKSLSDLMREFQRAGY